MMKYIKFFKELNKDTVGLVGGKNANLGEMYQKLTASGVRVPNGFAITAEGYDYFIGFNNLEERIKEILQRTNIYNVSELQKAGEEIRNLIKQGEFPEDLKNEILQAFKELKREYEEYNVSLGSSPEATNLDSQFGSLDAPVGQSIVSLGSSPEATQPGLGFRQSSRRNEPRETSTPNLARRDCENPAGTSGEK